MTVYAVVQLKITDRVEYGLYQSKFWDVFKKFDGKLLVSDESPNLLEGEWDADKIVVISFPSKEAFATWANSPEYTEILKHRLAGANASIILSKEFSLDDQPTFQT